MMKLSCPSVAIYSQRFIKRCRRCRYARLVANLARTERNTARSRYVVSGQSTNGLNPAIGGLVIQTFI
ncbi:hypothetical protein D0859_09939 [Hortaea werneckii]|uniref:Uncharacterized protein n=1 Tax=Hortaea werneckii TaxID=91943 RepID=A0A3M7IKB3_HORWE|nr:hypothetical protein D0859_09939 [Hortaea werneckii]